MNNARPEKPTLMIQSGTATTEFNSNSLTVFRIDEIIKRCNMFRKMLTFDGLQYWLIEVQNLDAELTGILSTKEDEALAALRVTQLYPSQNKDTIGYVMLQRKKIDAYERAVRRFIQLKGLGVTAKIEQDPFKIMSS